MVMFGFASGDTAEAEEQQRVYLTQCVADEERVYVRHGAKGVTLKEVLGLLEEDNMLFVDSIGCLDSVSELEALAAVVRKRGASVWLVREELEVTRANVGMLDKVIQGIRQIAERQSKRPYTHKRTGRPKTDKEKLRFAMKLYDDGEVTVSSICAQLGISRSVLYRAIWERRDNQINEAL